MERQHLKLMDTIAAIVGSLDKREMFQSIISHAGRQHAQFGAKPPHFVAFGDALLWGLEHQLGDTFTPELKEEHALRCRAKRNDAGGEITSVNGAR
jgi:nitric oxide dioxygenase